MNDVNQWFRDNGDNTLRLNYNLNKESIVFDVGGYKGWFTEQINNKYGSNIYCFEPIITYFNPIKDKFKKNNNIKVFNYAISNEIKKDIIYINDDGSSIYVKNNESIEIDCITIDKIMSENGINHIDLLKIDIEGAEYSLLEYMIKNNIVQKCNNIQVQFHNFIENYQDRYNNINNMLGNTHHLTYCYPFVWENWEINNI